MLSRPKSSSCCSRRPRACRLHIGCYRRLQQDLPWADASRVAQRRCCSVGVGAASLGVQAGLLESSLSRQVVGKLGRKAACGCARSACELVVLAARCPARALAALAAHVLAVGEAIKQGLVVGDEHPGLVMYL
eukprot:scaffold93731_cov78-Phaeocystis_antarctica.AAC.7